MFTMTGMGKGFARACRVPHAQMPLFFPARPVRLAGPGQGKHVQSQVQAIARYLASVSKRGLALVLGTCFRLQLGPKRLRSKTMCMDVS